MVVWLGKNVYVTKLDGYTKFGLCVEDTDSYIVIRFKDGKLEQIFKGPNVAIKEV